MKTWVIDASVVVKWFMTDAENESDIVIALKLLTALRNDQIKVLSTEAEIFSYFLSPLSLWERVRGKYRRISASVLTTCSLAC